MDYAKNVVSLVPAKVVQSVALLTMALGLMFSPARDAQAVGGAGRLR
jgi:hypothetical protein